MPWALGHPLLETLPELARRQHLDGLVPLWHQPATMSETESQFSLTGAAPNRERGKKPNSYQSDPSRLILSCAGGMPPGVSTENLRAFIEAAAPPSPAIRIRT